MRRPNGTHLEIRGNTFSIPSEGTWMAQASAQLHSGTGSTGPVLSHSYIMRLGRSSCQLQAECCFNIVSDGLLRLEKFSTYPAVDQAQVCHTLTLVDDASNCYRQIILPLSISHECVRRSILAVSALYLSLNQPYASVDYYSLALLQKQRTLYQLRKDIASLNGGSNNHILVSMLMLCLFDVGSIPRRVLSIGSD